MSWELILSVLAALAIGFFLGRLSLQRNQNLAAQDVELHNTQAEFDRYKAEVSEHLRETSELMHAAESNYQQLSEQLLKTKQLLSDVKTVEPAPHGASPAHLPPKDYSAHASGLLRKDRVS